MPITSEVQIFTFQESSVSAGAIAACHLLIRAAQEQSDENQFFNIFDSQLDLSNIPDYYCQDGNFWVAQDIATQAIAGFVGLKNQHQGIAEVKRLSVMPEYRGQRLGRRLMINLVEWAKEKEIMILALSTGSDEKAHDLIYKPLGFYDVGFNATLDDVYMQLEL